MASGELVPDFGPAEPHPSAGATLVTARAPLAAFNVELSGLDLEAAQAVARALRESGGGLAGVRAIAIALSPETVQISTNVHDPVTTTLATVVAEIERLAGEAGGRAEAAELIGLIPEAALRDYPEHVPIRDFDPGSRTIEARLAEAGSRAAAAGSRGARRPRQARAPAAEHQPPLRMWSRTWLNSSVGEKSTYSLSSSASGACPGPQ